MYGDSGSSHRHLKSRMKDGIAVDTKGRVYGDLDRDWRKRLRWKEGGFV